jgi:hypothetical protein
MSRANDAAVHPHNLPAARKPTHTSITTFHMPFFLCGLQLTVETTTNTMQLHKGNPLREYRGYPDEQISKGTHTVFPF